MGWPLSETLMSGNMMVGQLLYNHFPRPPLYFPSYPLSHAMPSVRARSRLHGLAALRNPDVWKHDGMLLFSVSPPFFLPFFLFGFRELQGKVKYEILLGKYSLFSCFVGHGTCDRLLQNRCYLQFVILNAPGLIPILFHGTYVTSQYTQQYLMPTGCIPAAQLLDI